MDLDRSLPLGRQSEMTNWRSTSGRANLPTTCLQDELAAALVPTHPSQHDREFLPKEALTSILTEERVRQVLAVDFESVLPEKRINEYAKTICARKIRGDDGRLTTRSYIKILAILVLCRKTTAIVRILEDSSRVSDADLPLERVRRPGHDNLYDLRARNKSGMLLKPMECFQKDWDQMNIRSFEEWQWTALPRIFGKPISHEKVRHYDLRDKEILPFVQDSQGAHDQSVSSKHEFEGGFATVFQVAIHPQHHHFGRPPDALYAVKSLHSKNVTAFEREVEILNKFRGDQHSHLISLLATYQQHNRFFLLFDWADADLKTYWTVRNPSPSFDMSTVRWMARQCTGIAHGIIRIHTHKTTYRPLNAPGGGAATVFGHHGDIKPENVLWFAKPPSPSSSSSSLPLSEDLTSGTLKLSDFGLARFSIHQHTRSMTPASKWAATLAYRAPETDLHPEAAIGRSYDMWTLGCLYLEFVTWALGGKALLEQFVMQRRAPDGSLYNVHTHSFFELRVEEAPGRVDVAGKPRVRAVVKPSVKEVRTPSLLTFESLDYGCECCRVANFFHPKKKTVHTGKVTQTQELRPVLP